MAHPIKRQTEFNAACDAATYFARFAVQPTAGDA